MSLLYNDSVKNAIKIFMYRTCTTFGNKYSKIKCRRFNGEYLSSLNLGQDHSLVQLPAVRNVRNSETVQGTWILKNKIHKTN